MQIRKNIKVQQNHFRTKDSRKLTSYSREKSKKSILNQWQKHILAIGHLSEACNRLFTDSKAVPLHIHRTKCAGIINNILGPYFRSELKKDIGDSPYSLIIDESTDLSTSKMLGIVIKYYSTTLKKIVSTYLCLEHIDDGKADSIVSSIVAVLNKMGLDIKNMKGLGTDNASVMVGANNGVFQKLKDEFGLAKLILIRCVCHSLQLGISAATTDSLPRNVEFLVRETYNWFQHSPLRQTAYNRIYELINEGSKPLKILQLSQTPWISIEPAVRRILSQYLELKTHFGNVRHQEGCYTAELLFSMYNDPVNKVYLEFLHPILEEIQKVNKCFESNSSDPTKLQQDLINLIYSLARRVINPGRFREIDIITCDDFMDYLDPSPYLGYSFEHECRVNNIVGEQRENLKQCCFNFCTKLLSQLKQSLPNNLNIIRKINIFAVSECLKHSKPEITDLARYYFDAQTITKIEIQWNNLNNVQWQNKTDTLKFWSEVNDYRDASGENPFKELTTLAMNYLTLPHSNADVERLFSQMNLAKSKLRNRINLHTLNNILQIKFGLKRTGTCCNNFQVPDHIQKQVETSITYASSGGSASTSTNEIDLTEEADILQALNNE